LPGFGKLVKQKRKARTGFNPKTQQKIKIPAKTVVKFRVAKAAKDAVLRVWHATIAFALVKNMRLDPKGLEKVSRIEFQGFDGLEEAQAFCEKNALDVERALHGSTRPPETPVS
jgi:hypothetical protein